jgi:sulfopyruvate decarboxylase TPP-binding subunit
MVNMSCYIRHMKDFLNDLEIPLETKQERKNADLAIRKVIGKTKNDKCNMVWLEVKVWLQDEDMKQKLADDLKLEEISS